MRALIPHHRQLLGIARSWAMKNLPGWSAEAHQDLLARHGAGGVEGRLSATTLNLTQLNAALTDYERRGWPRRRQQFAADGATARNVPPQIAHLVRLWGQLDQAGKLTQPTRKALLAYCARQTGHAVADLDSLSSAEAQAIIESLKQWLRRP